jgi:two-component system, NarL family, invasion response regulator UvrY
VKIVIVDDHPIVLSGCRTLIAETKVTTMLEEPCLLRNLVRYLRSKMRLVSRGPTVWVDRSRYEMRGDRPRRFRRVRNNDPAQQCAASANRQFFGGSASGIFLLPQLWRASCIFGTEFEVLRLVAKGKSIPEIAALINVSYRTLTTCNLLRTKFSCSSFASRPSGRSSERI